MEQELYLFIKHLFGLLVKIEPSILDVQYQVQRTKYTIEDIFTHKPNVGTYKFLLNHKLIKEAIQKQCNSKLRFYLTSGIFGCINTIQNQRNESVHGGKTQLEDALKIREKIIGVCCNSIIIELVQMRMESLN